ncbi:MAG: phage tail protein [Clostridium sp.]|nr:phage tail protein [Clostridium sp.]MCM1207649.1 phage tail protein [Ruminococcus sp.]
MDSKNVTTGKPRVGGAVFVAPVGTVLPQNATDQLDEKFKDLGYCSDDGITNSNTPESDSIKAWGGDVVLNVQTGKEDTFTLKLIEALNINVLKTVYKDENVSGNLDEGIKIKVNAKEQEPSAWVIDMLLRGNILKRIVIPEASITEIGEIKYGDEDVIGYELTLGATPDETANTHYEYVKRSNTEDAESGQAVG